jgi:hypothetical protein
MIHRPAFATLVLAILLYPGLGRSEQFRPSTYDECITDTMKGVSSDVAANAIIESCRNQFPKQVEAVPVQEDPAPEQEAVAAEQAAVATGTSRSLTPAELGKLRATAFVSFDTYRVTFHNDNEHLTITEVTIAVGDESATDGKNRYSQRVRIGPLESGSAKYSVPYEGNGFELDTIDVSKPAWSVVAAEGID